MRSQVLLLLTFLFYFISEPTFSTVLDNQYSQLDQAISKICDKKLVLLGEDANHGSGETIRLKAELVKHLIEKCGFSGVFFESPVYEFIHYAESVKQNNASNTQVTQSIGGLWSRANMMHSFSLFLHNKAKSGKIKLAGIDAQFGANQPYSQKQLPKRLSSYLEHSKANTCEDELYRYLNWQYDEKTPFDKNTKNRIISCVSDIRIKIGEISVVNSQSSYDLFMANNFIKFLQFSSGNYFNLRDEQMAKNVLWQINQLPDNSKVVVWGATVHMAKTLTPIYTQKVPMAAHLKQVFKDTMESVGFTALSGKFGRSLDKLKELKPAPLARWALEGNTYTIRYIDHHNLATLGEIEAQPIQYNEIHRADWSKILDSLIVIRNEKPLAY